MRTHEGWAFCLYSRKRWRRREAAVAYLAGCQQVGCRSSCHANSSHGRFFQQLIHGIIIVLLMLFMLWPVLGALCVSEKMPLEGAVVRRSVAQRHDGG